MYVSLLHACNGDMCRCTRAITCSFLAFMTQTIPSQTPYTAPQNDKMLHLLTAPVSLGHKSWMSDRVAARAPTPQFSSTSMLPQSCADKCSKSCIASRQACRHVMAACGLHASPMRAQVMHGTDSTTCMIHVMHVAHVVDAQAPHLQLSSRPNDLHRIR